VASELSSPCPPGGPLGWLGCGGARDLALGSFALGALLYLGALSGTLAWVARLQDRGVADQAAARDWYLLVALIGLPLAPMLAFTLLSALR